MVMAIDILPQIEKTQYGEEDHCQVQYISVLFHMCVKLKSSGAIYNLSVISKTDNFLKL